MPTTVITNVGITAVEAAGTTGPLINVTGAWFGSDLLPVPAITDAGYDAYLATMRTQTIVGGQVYTADATKIRYRIVNANTVQYIITLDTSVGDFTIGNFGLFVTHGTTYTLLTYTALDSQEVKTATSSSVALGSYRTYNVFVTMANLPDLSSFTIEIAVDGNIPEVATEAALPAAAMAPYDLYLVDTYTVLGNSALASPIAGVWQYFPDLAWITATLAPINSPSFLGSPEVGAAVGSGSVTMYPGSTSDSSAAMPNTKWVQQIVSPLAPKNNSPLTGTTTAQILDASTNISSPLITANTFSAIGTTAGTAINLISNLDTFRAITFYTVPLTGTYAGTSLSRWAEGTDNSTEAGTNAGSNYFMQAYDDTGTYLGQAYTINRASQIVDFIKSPTMPTPTAGDSSSKGADTAFVTTAIAAIPVPVLVPVGGIIMWYSTIASVPGPHWQLCDGTSGTPDLRNKFIMGAGDTGYSSPGTTGGTSSQAASTTGSAGAQAATSTGSHTLLIADIPAHSHSITDVSHSHNITDEAHNHSLPMNPSAFGSTNTLGCAGVDAAITYASYNTGSAYTGITATQSSVTGLSGTNNAGGGGGHSHSIAAVGSHTHSIPSWDNRPAFYALAFIMRIS